MNEITKEDWDEALAAYPEVERPDHIDEETWNGMCAASRYHTATCPPFETVTIKAEHAVALEEAGALEAAALLRPYEWYALPGMSIDNPQGRRARCREHGKTMKWAMKLDQRYPDQTSKHTGPGQRWRVPVEYKGLMVQVWRCPEEGCDVEVQR